MQQEELERAWEINARLQAKVRQITSLRANIEQIVPIRDGQPSKQVTDSRIARLSVLIIDLERELDKVREEYRVAAQELLIALSSAQIPEKEREVLINRYVHCLEFTEISAKMRYSMAYIMKLHSLAKRRILEKLQEM